MIKGLLLLPLVAAYQVMETSDHNANIGAENYDGMKVTLKSIAAMQQKGEIDKDTIQIVEKMLDDIESNLKKCLFEDVNKTQEMLDDAEAAIARCDSDRVEWFTNPSKGYAVLDSFVVMERDEHEECRHLYEADECANATAACNNYTAQVCGWDSCTKPPSSRFTHDNDDVFAYLCCLDNFFFEEGERFYDNRFFCEEAYDIWCEQMEDCDLEQEEFEHAFCAREEKVEKACETYRECRNAKQATYTEIKSEVQYLEEIYQAQRVALECLLCYGNKILSNATSLEDCEILPPCTDLTDCPIIDYDPIENCTSCLEPNHNIPCTDNFTNTYYSQFNGTCTPPQACTPCTFDQTEDGLFCDELEKTQFELDHGL